jgi:hypothetical protein
MVERPDYHDGEGEFMEFVRSKDEGPSDEAEAESVAAVSASQGQSPQPVGRMVQTALGGLTAEQKIGLAAAGVILLAAMSGDSGGDSGSDPSGGDPESNTSEVDCPECGSSKSKRGMEGHLRWGHDLAGEELAEARKKVGIGG